MSSVGCSAFLGKPPLRLRLRLEKWPGLLPVRISAWTKHRHQHSPASDACFKNSPKNLIIRSPTASPFFTPNILRTHLVTSLLNASSSNCSSSCCCTFLFFPTSCGSKQHRSWIILKCICSFLCIAVEFCASLKIWHICVRRSVSGPSSGTSTAYADVRAEADPRVDLSVAVDDLRDTVVFEERAVRVEVRPGIVWIYVNESLVYSWCIAGAVKPLNDGVVVDFFPKAASATPKRKHVQHGSMTILRHRRNCTLIRRGISQLAKLKSTKLHTSFPQPSLYIQTMFRTASRSFTASIWRSAENLSQLEASYATGINISKAQGVGQRGFIDGTHTIPPPQTPHNKHLTHTPQSNRQNPAHPPQKTLRRNRLQHPRQSGIPKPRRLCKRPRRPLRRRKRRAQGPPLPRRHRHRRHRRKHRHRPRSRLPLKRIQARHLHAQHAIPGQNRPLASPRRRSLPRSGRRV